MELREIVKAINISQWDLGTETKIGRTKIQLWQNGHKQLSDEESAKVKTLVKRMLVNKIKELNIYLKEFPE